ncbi:patatin [Burkholderia sp. THE68]|uniref:CBASS cGAMP-activated phospholipase n=1 Tax=Burkholderia sp. THE68 TaxID=758782 RepID=UPI0013172921|nr:CBASS cGAMP-activated phospholipase [Burkholderia sp. THE68]BBU30384.1 patatin [Burkholderia sp. THE68]
MEKSLEPGASASSIEEQSSTKWTMDMPFQALALTGGGYRGLFTAQALDVMEKEAGPIARHFDLICGTSIGGIVALAAAFEVPMSRVVEVFVSEGQTIFPPGKKPTGLGVVLDLWKYKSTPRYASQNLRAVISQLIPADATLSDALHPLCIPAVNVTEGKPQIFKTRHKAEWRRDWKLKAVDVALATAAAPTFFELAEVGNSRYADGGLFANAPDLVAIHEAEHFFDVPREGIRLLSVGTTTRKYSVSHSAGRAFGVLDWMSDQRLFNVIISAQQQFVDQLVSHRLGENYLRIDHEPSNEQANDLGLDVATEAARTTLLALADKAVTDVLGTKLRPYLKHEPQLELVRGD